MQTLAPVSASQPPLSTDALFSGLLCAGRYRIGESVGEGSMGQLFRAQRLRDGREVVLKCVSGSGASSRRQLRAEAHALASLDHPHIVGFVEHGEGTDVCFIAMEALEGSDLGARIRQGTVPRATALRWLRELGSALDHLHERGFVHRDIKPGNVVIHRDAEGEEHAVLVDFGLATEHVPGARARGQFLCGTPAYMAPEQAVGLESAIGPATDRYALAAIALELLTGHRPYPSASIGELLVMLVEQPPRKPSALGPFDATLDAVFAEAMARDPGRRFESAAAMVSAIEAGLPRSMSRTRRARATQGTPTVRAKAA
jgi:serine/threonine protein kinase